MFEDDEGPAVRIPLGLSLQGGPTIRQLVRRVAMCGSVAAAGQAALNFLEEESMLDARLGEVDGQLVVERRAPSRPRQLDLAPSRPRRGLDTLLLRAADQHDELREEILQAAAASTDGLTRTGDAMNTLPAEQLPRAFAEIERELGVTTAPARLFIAAKQAGFPLEVDDATPVQFDAPSVRTRTTTSFRLGLSIATGGHDDVLQFPAMVLARRPMDGRAPADLPVQLFPLERDSEFRISGLSDWQRALLGAARELGLVIEVTARPSVSTATLRSKGGEVEAILNWEELLLAVLKVLQTAPAGSADAAVA